MLVDKNMYTYPSLKWNPVMQTCLGLGPGSEISLIGTFFI